MNRGMALSARTLRAMLGPCGRLQPTLAARMPCRGSNAFASDNRSMMHTRRVGIPSGSVLAWRLGPSRTAVSLPQAHYVLLGAGGRYLRTTGQHSRPTAKQPAVLHLAHQSKGSPAGSGHAGRVCAHMQGSVGYAVNQELAQRQVRPQRSSIFEHQAVADSCRRTHVMAVCKVCCDRTRSLDNR